jgi:hypothetical protein
MVVTKEPGTALPGRQQDISISFESQELSCDLRFVDIPSISNYIANE